MTKNKLNNNVTEKLMRLCYNCDNVRNCETIEKCLDCFNDQLVVLIDDEAGLREHFRLYAL